MPIGRSDKRLGIDRGFRGVGRLAGLAFAKTVSFTTRACKDEAVTRITWHSDRLPELTSTELELEEAILDCVDVETLQSTDYPEHFFEVEVGDVARHSSGLLLNRNTVRDYVGEVCPVPMCSEFPFINKVEELFHGDEAPLTLEVQLKGDSDPIERPYGKSIRFSANREAKFTEFESIRIPSVDGNSEAALGWIAHSSYLGAIPKEQRVRGIRVRAGNIQIGGEAVLDALFAEERFNRWCVGELHILDSQVIPNARRDYFQLGPHLRDLENQLIPVLRNISTRCRKESKVRNRVKRTFSALCNIEDLCDLATSGYFTSEDSVDLVQKTLREVENVRKNISKGNLDCSILKKLKKTEDKLNDFSGEVGLQQFNNLDPSETDIYQRVFRILVDLASSPRSAKDTIESVLADASKIRQNGSGANLAQTALVDTKALAPE